MTKGECECPPEHTVCKLGHCASCPWHGVIQIHPSRMMTTNVPRVWSWFACPPGCVDEKHDFNWATYADDMMSTGVCKCGLREIDLSILVMP